jgi:calcineurin-like phosphoesterase family protein
MTTWFTSDYHLNHPRILELDKRPFGNTKEMAEIILMND